jgi:hypothetical protein
VGREAGGWAWEKKAVQEGRRGSGPRRRERSGLGRGDGERADRRLRPRWLGQKLEMGPSSKRNSFRISIDFRIWQNFRKLHKEILEET